MKNLPVLLLLCVVGTGLVTEVAHASDDDVFLGEIQPRQEQTMGQGRSALWTLPLVATQYQPVSPTPEMRSALQAQQEGRFLEALILLDEAGKKGQPSAESAVELNLLRASFLLQGNESPQAIEILTPLLANAQHGADASALAAMAFLQQGKMQQAQEAANRAHDADGNILPHLAQSYTLQSAGRLAEAREMMHSVNSRTPQSAITLAREAELALTQAQVKAAKALLVQAREIDAAHPYVVAVSGLTWLIDGKAEQAKVAFETALQRDPKDARALLGLALADVKLGNFEAGQKKLQAANEADPDNALILTYLGRAQQQSGQTEAARASWHSAQQADPKDPAPWLYQAQAELQANHPLEAQESLRQAQARVTYRSVYRGERLLKEDEQLLQTNLAEIQRRLGLEHLAFHTLTDPVGERDASSLRNQADVLQGQRFGVSARRSLLLQSLFNDRPGNLPSELDIYGDGAGQTGASVPQHGAINSLGSQQASYNNYDELFNRRTKLEADATLGSRSSQGGQIRLGVGNDTLGLSLAGLKFKSDGFAPYNGLDNNVAQGVVQWRPSPSTQAFVSSQSFNSQHGETYFPAAYFAYFAAITDNSRVTRVGLRQNLTDNSELRGLLSFQQTDQVNNDKDFSGYVFSQAGSGSARSAELQYRRWGANHSTQLGMQHYRGGTVYWDDISGEQFFDQTSIGQKVYGAWQRVLNPYWQLDVGLAYGKLDQRSSTGIAYLSRWQPGLGVIYTPDALTHLRLAAWQGLGIPTVGDATLAPVNLAGILLSRPDDNRKWVHAVNLNADRQLSPAWSLAAEVQRRMNEVPVGAGGEQEMYWQQVDESGLTMHWQPEERPWNVSLAYDYEHISNDSRLFVLDGVNGQNLHQQKLAVRWFASTQWTLNLQLSRNQVDGTQQALDPVTYDTITPAYQDSFYQVDASLSWRFNGTRGLFSAGVRNVADTHFLYTDVDKLNPRFSNGRMLYAKVKNAW